MVHFEIIVSEVYTKYVYCTVHQGTTYVRAQFDGKPMQQATFFNACTHIQISMKFCCVCYSFLKHWKQWYAIEKDDEFTGSGMCPEAPQRVSIIRKVQLNHWIAYYFGKQWNIDFSSVEAWRCLNNVIEFPDISYTLDSWLHPSEKLVNSAFNVCTVL